MKVLKVVLMCAAILTYSSYAGDDKTSASLDFSLPGSDGKQHTLADYTDAKAVVVMFIATRCPISNGFNERMVELAKMYQPQGIDFLGINSNKIENMDEVKIHAAEHGFPFVVLKDDQNVIADLYKAKVTPEVYVLGSQRNVLYHGRIDDSANVNERKSQDLVNALDDILAGRLVKNSETKAFGCTIKRISM